MKLERTHYLYLRSYWGELQLFYSRPASEFTVQKVDRWLTDSKLKLNPKDQVGLEAIETLVQAAKDPINFSMNQGIFGRKAMEILGACAQQQWARLFYSNLGQEEDEEALDRLYESTKLIWGHYLFF